MNLNDLHEKLMAVARKNPPSDHVPYAFEKRIMSRVADITPPSPWALWGGPLWRGAVSCVAITVLCGVWSFASSRQADSPESFSQAFEAAVFTPPSQHAEDAW
jgi:hypothetical protein